MKSLFEMTLLLILIFKPTDLQRPSFKNEWVAWNVGQGQWVTHIEGDICRHYDVGGEISFARDLKIQIQNLCFGRKNEVFISHWDLDHFSMLPVLVRWVPSVCMGDAPPELIQKKSVSKIQTLNIRSCRLRKRPTLWRPRFYKTTNESSAVYSDQKILIPGDSPVAKEKIWLQHFKNLDQIKILILGHHGSRTSTGVALLKRLNHLKFAISSARYAKYRHPHTMTVKRLRKRAVPVLKTEDWGNIHWIGN